MPLLSVCSARAVVLACCVSLYVLGILEAAAAETSAFTKPAELRYQSGQIDARINQVPLAEVLRELGLKTGTRVNLTDPSIAAWPVSASIQAMPLEPALKAILDGFSYVIYAGSKRPGIIVLSTDPNPARMYKAMSALTHHAQSAPQALHAASINSTAANRVPQSLEDFQPITTEEVSSGGELEDGQDGSPSGQSAQDQEYHDALLQRALAVMNSEHKHLLAEAIDELAGLEDPRAIESLVKAASYNSGLDAQTRVRAVTALSQQAINSRFSDPASVNALTHLVEDSDANVRELAEKALHEMQR